MVRIACLTALWYLLLGCDAAKIDVQKTLDKYLSEAQVRSDTPECEIATFFSSPRFLALSRMRNVRETGLGAVDSIARRFSDGYYVTVCIKAKGQPANGDLFSASLEHGKEAYSDLLALFQGGMGERVQLETPSGVRVPPSAYTLERGWGLRSDLNLIFVFPKEWNGKPLPIFESDLVISDFGAHTGTVRHKVLKPSPIKMGYL